MPTTPVTTSVSGSPFSVNVTAATLDTNNSTRDFLVLENGTLTLNPNSYTKVSAGTSLQYNGPVLAALTTLEVRRRTPRNIRVVQAVGTKIRSSDWNAEFDRIVRIAEEYDIYGAGGGFSVRLPLNNVFGPGWDGDILFPPTRNAVYDEIVTKAGLVSPVLTGNPTAPTPATVDNSTSIATTSYVKSNLGAYATLASPALTGVPTAPTPLTADNSTTLPTTAYVKANLASYVLTTTLASYLTAASAAATYATIASPALTGVPTAPTATALTNTTQLATTAYSLDAAAIKLGNVVTVFAVPNIDWVIPANTRRVTLLYSGNSFTDGTRIRLGDSGGVVTTNYVGQVTYTGSFSGSRDYGYRSTITDGLRIAETETATDGGCVVMTKLGNTNTWILAGTSLLTATLGTYTMTAAGRVVLSGTLTTVRLIPPSSNFVAGGTVQVMWEY